MGNEIINLDKKVKLLRKQMKHIEGEAEIIEKECEDEKKKIDAVYEPKIKEKLHNANLKFQEYLELEDILKKCSLFNLNNFGPVLADLTTKIEGEKFNYYIIKYSDKVHGFWDPESQYYVRTLAIISKEDREELEYSALNLGFDTFFEYYKDGILSNDVFACKEEPNYIQIYKYYIYEIQLSFPFLEYQKPYVKDFIDYVIDIRIKNKIKKINREELNLYLDEFIKNYEIQNNSSQKTKKKVKKIDK